MPPEPSAAVPSANSAGHCILNIERLVWALVVATIDEVIEPGLLLRKFWRQAWWSPAARSDERAHAGHSAADGPA